MATVGTRATETTGDLRGSIQQADGSPASGVLVQLLDTRNGLVRSIIVSDSGTFQIPGLEIGGPYSVTISSPASPQFIVDDIHISLGQTHDLKVELAPAESLVEELLVTGSAPVSSLKALGPSTIYGLSDLESAPAINRDLKDLIRLDPRVYIDEAFVDAIVCAGINPRFNSQTVDGARLNDLFGLNSNGYPTQRSPFSYDVLRQVAVEFAPFDVQYSGFSACNVNAVTKSGSNEFRFSAFADYTSDSLHGSSLEGDDVELGSFEETRWSLMLSGPVIEDRLFFLVSYESLEGADTFDRGPVGSGQNRETTNWNSPIISMSAAANYTA